MKTIVVSLVLLIYSYSVSAQCKEWNYGSDAGTKKAIEEKIVILQDAVREKNYKLGASAVQWLVSRVTQPHYSLFVHGVTVYEGLAAVERDPVWKNVYIDSMLWMYDQRLRLCGEPENVLWRKASSAFKFQVNDIAVVKLIPIMDSVFNKYPDTAPDALLLSYMQTVVVARTKTGKPDDVGILARYDRINQIISQRLNANAKDAKRVERLNGIRKGVEEWLFRAIKPDCNFVRTKLAPEFKKNPNDAPLAKRIFAFMLLGKCTDDPMWLKAGEVVFRKQKDYDIAKNIALRYLSETNFKRASSYLDSALALAHNKKDSSEVFFYKGASDAGIGDKPQARKDFLRAATLDPTKKEAYEKIGDLYYHSFKDCATMKVQADDRGVYLAAYTWYARAENKKKMDMARASFPSREEIFVVNRKKGEHMKVNCWIDEEVVIQTRD